MHLQRCSENACDAAAKQQGWTLCNEFGILWQCCSTDSLQHCSFAALQMCFSSGASLSRETKASRIIPRFRCPCRLHCSFPQRSRCFRGASLQMFSLSRFLSARGMLAADLLLRRTTKAFGVPRDHQQKWKDRLCSTGPIRKASKDVALPAASLLFYVASL